jgi:LPXTG-site transpeptidase (sortase) family protein
VKAILLLVTVYFLSAPLIPGVSQRLSLALDETKGYRYASIETAPLIENGLLRQETLQPIPEVNTLVIPQIGVDAQIYESINEDVLDMGVWRRPNSNTPPQGGNTVLAAHRYQRTTGSNTFYLLDELEVGDRFTVFWEKKEYRYEVFDILVVDPSQTHIEDQTEKDIMTLYTCTPLWTGEDRLVIQAKKISET